MSKSVLTRLSKLEAAAGPPGRVIPMFAWGRTDEEIEAEQADMIKRGVATPSDTFQVFTWMEASDTRHRR